MLTSCEGTLRGEDGGGVGETGAKSEVSQAEGGFLMGLIRLGVAKDMWRSRSDAVDVWRLWKVSGAGYTKADGSCRVELTRIMMRIRERWR